MRVYLASLVLLAVLVAACSVAPGVERGSAPAPGVPTSSAPHCTYCVYGSTDLAFEDTSDNRATSYRLGLWPFLEGVQRG